MKRMIAALLLFSLCLCFTGCDALDYSKATRYYNDGEYAKALELYESLGDYADSEAMAHLSWQKADYEAAGQAYDEGNYRKAMELYYGLDMYMDSPVKAIESQYALGVSLIESREYSEAIALLEELGTFEDSAQQAQNAKALWIMEALEQTDGVSLSLDSKGEKRLSLAIADENSLALVYEGKTQLLGVPNESNFTLILFPFTREANYTADYRSVASRTILEEATGTADLAVYNARQGLSTHDFVQTITEPDETVTTSKSTADAIILPSLFIEAGTIISENLATLLAQTGTDLTPEDLGFLALNA